VSALLAEQATLTVVSRFSQLHDAQDVHEAPLKEKYYRDLLPLSQPRAGEQLAFEVDLDRCTGCKACVSACHTLNGLDDKELWRSVGLLHGGTQAAPVQQTVTSACHHCVDPACLNGCPTRAYEKDPVTGIVKHLDDQCFGCQYCTLMCPYDAPKFNPARGIVRKCDMCSGRLAHGEAPACVQACPSGAIAIRVVSQSSIVAASDAQRFLPGAPAPAHTLPSTQYKTARALPNNLLPADFYSTRPEHSHPPLVVMLTLTQLSVGAFVLALWMERVHGHAIGNALAHAVLAAVMLLLALAASIFHLGRPTQAWRAVLGLRTSWLSREALVFGLYAQGVVGYCALLALELFPKPLEPVLALFGRVPVRELARQILPYLRHGTALIGVLGVYCSVMVYVATRREHWSATQTGLKFFGSTLTLGAAAVFCVALWSVAPGMQLPTELLDLVLAGASVKLALELHALQLVRDVRSSTPKRMAIVMLGELRGWTFTRLTTLLLGGVGWPALMLAGWLPSSAWQGFATLGLVLLLVSELCERYLFFRAAPASRMPGALR